MVARRKFAPERFPAAAIMEYRPPRVGGSYIPRRARTADVPRTSSTQPAHLILMGAVVSSAALWSTYRAIIWSVSRARDPGALGGILISSAADEEKTGKGLGAFGRHTRCGSFLHHQGPIPRYGAIPQAATSRMLGSDHVRLQSPSLEHGQHHYERHPIQDLHRLTSLQD